MDVRDSVLTGRPAPLADGATLTLDRAFQGLPDMAHGGTVLALFDALAARRGPRRVRGHYLKRVSLLTPLVLRHAAGDGAARLGLSDAAGTTLVDGAVDGAPAPTAPAQPPASGAHALPVSTGCFVCGAENALGLRARFAFDDDAVATVWTPRDTVRAADGTLAPVALTGLCDEAAFWLGALATGESGMTTELEVTLAGPVPFGPVTVVGDRRRVVARADDPRYTDTEIAAFGADGALAATARITFVAVRGAARRLVAALLPTNGADVVRRVFPAYAAR